MLIFLPATEKEVKTGVRFDILDGDEIIVKYVSKILSNDGIVQMWLILNIYDNVMVFIFVSILNVEEMLNFAESLFLLKLVAFSEIISMHQCSWLIQNLYHTDIFYHTCRSV